MYKKRSEHLVNWVNSHPLINVKLLCEMAGMNNWGNFSNALLGHRSVSPKYIDYLEKVLKEYGFEPLTKKQLSE
jgi:hypothetical protein